MLSALSVAIAMVRVISAGRRFNREVGLDSREAGAEGMWLMLFLFKDMVTPGSRWQPTRSNSGAD